MHYFFILLVAFSFTSCVIEKKSKIYSSVDEWRESTIDSDSMIVIDKSFNPTLELTKEIKDSSLEELIIKRYYEKKNIIPSLLEMEVSGLVFEKILDYIDFFNYGDFVKKIQNLSVIYDISEYALEELKDKELVEEIMRKNRRFLKPSILKDEIKLTSISKKTNVAKAYFLQDPESFIEYNSRYYEGIINKEKQNEKNKKELEQMKKWRDYNKDSINNEVFYKEFPQYGFAVKTDCDLNDVSAYTSGDFLVNLGGTIDGNDRNKMAAYQLMVIRVPIGYVDLSKEEYEEKMTEALNHSMQKFENHKRIVFGYEQYKGFECETLHNGYKQKAVTFIKNNYIITMSVISNYKLEERFNKFTNGFKTL